MPTEGSSQPARLYRAAHKNLGRSILSYLKHELSQPLGAIMLSAEACALGVRAGKMDPEQILADLEQINQEAERANGLMARLREQAGRLQESSVTGDLNEPLRRLATILSEDFAGSDTELHLFLAEDLPGATFDPLLLQLAVLELVDNARVATAQTAGSQAGGHVWVRSTVREAPPAVVTITVEDDGPGTADLTIDKLTDPFFTTWDGHLGMGLTQCRSLVEAQAGELALGTPTCGGACFLVHLPVPSPA